MKRVLILLSGGGSNMQALVDAIRSPQWASDVGVAVQVVAVISDRPDVMGLTRAQMLGIPQHCVNFKQFAERTQFEAVLFEQIQAYAPDLVILAGFMRILSKEFVAKVSPNGNRLMNIHPSLLPAFPGLHTHQRALAMGVKLHGATVHWVSDQLDYGPIIAQAVVPVLQDDTVETLSRRVLEQEHLMYAKVLGWWASNKLKRVSAEQWSSAIGAGAGIPCLDKIEASFESQCLASNTLWSQA